MQVIKSKSLPSQNSGAPQKSKMHLFEQLRPFSELDKTPCPGSAVALGFANTNNGILKKGKKEKKEN